MGAGGPLWQPAWSLIHQCIRARVQVYISSPHKCTATPSVPPQIQLCTLPSQQEGSSPKGQPLPNLARPRMHPAKLLMHLGRLRWSLAQQRRHRLRTPAMCHLHLQTHLPMTPESHQCCPLLSCQRCCCCCLLQLLIQSRRTPQRCLHAMQGMTALVNACGRNSRCLLMHIQIISNS